MSTDSNPSLPTDPEAIVSSVRESYGRIAVTHASCCGPGAPGASCGGDSERLGYSPEQLAELPPEADLGLGCGAPLTLLDAQPGETVLDLGSGPGLDAFLAARAVGPTGHVIGVDMTPEMVERARRTAERAGFTQVEFRQGRLEALPVEDASIDAVISNCVINLVPDKGRVFAEAARVLKPGGRMVISDIVLSKPLPEAIVRHLPAWVGCVSGAVLQAEYLAILDSAGFSEVEVLVDRDALALFPVDLPAEVGEALARSETSAESIRGTVRSLTFRATKS